MHDAGGYVDVSTLLPLFITFVLVSVSLAFLKNTAAKYLANPNLRFDPEPVQIQQTEKKVEFTSMLDQHNVCAVCGEPGPKRCSRCKAVHYCSSECQTKHWTQGHKLDCRSGMTPTQGALKNSSISSNAFETSKKNPISLKVSSAGISLASSDGTSDGILPKPKKVLFPYKMFVEFFNWDKQRLTPCGLVNCGNSCFANVVLQCLTCTRPLVAYLLEGTHMLTCTRNDWCFLCELHQHIRRVSQSEEPFSPFGILCHIPKMGGNLGCGKQEDAHEFMRVAIDSMQSICLDEFGGEKAVDLDSRLTTLICHIFGGYLQSQVICTQCHQVSNRYEHMLDLNVEIHGDVASLEDALDQFTGHEWLDGDNKYYCDGCNTYVRAQKQLSILQAPNILTIALKRFQTGRFGKLNKRVTFPETLDLSPYVSGKEESSHIYKLYAVVVHVDMLNASFFGHYICYVKDLHGLWYRTDDAKVKRVELEEVLSQRAYMLLYSRICVRSSSAADIPKSTAPNMAKVDCSYSASLVHRQSHITQSRTDGYLSSPFEVVEPLRSNLGVVQEGISENVGALDSLLSSDELRGRQKSNAVDCDADVSVDLASEESGSLTNNSSCSEDLSIKAGQEELDKVLPSLPELNPPNMCLPGTSSYPLFLEAKNFDASSPSSIGNVEHNVSVDHVNERSMSVDPLASMEFFPQKNYDDEIFSSSVSKQLHDTPVTNDLIEDEVNRTTAVQSSNSDLQLSDKMSCDDEVEQPSVGNSSDSFLALLKESSVMEDIVDSSVQQIPIEMNKTLFSHSNSVALPNLSLDVWSNSMVGGNQHTTLFDNGDFCGPPVRNNNAYEADLMEDQKDFEHKILMQEGPATEKKRHDFHPDVACSATQPSERETLLFNKEHEIVPVIVSQMNSTPTKENGVSIESSNQTNKFPKENGMAERIQDSSSKQELHEYNYIPDYNGKSHTNQNTYLKNTQAAMLEGSGTSPEFSPIPVHGAEVITSCVNNGASSTPVRKTVKSKPIFAPGFLKRPPTLSVSSSGTGSSLKDLNNDVVGSKLISSNGKDSISLSQICLSPNDSSNNVVAAKLMTSNGKVSNSSSISYSSPKDLSTNVFSAETITQNDKDSVLTSGTCSSHTDRSDNVFGAKLMTSNSFQCDIDSQVQINVSSNEISSIPVDESKMASPIWSDFDTDTREEVIVPHPCQASGAERLNNMKTKSLFTPGFLNRASKSQIVSQSKLSQMDCSEVVQSVVRANESGPFDTNSCTPMPSQSGTDVRPVDVVAEYDENVGHDQSGSSASSEKELIGSGRKRTLSSESLHTEQGSSITMNSIGKTSLIRQKQGRNDCCSCGSQRKWKKCCGRPDALRPIAGR
ncbi:hypothetical protein SUGI_0554660 [Cryptomeria japonica]|uniref:uncharacterized protein LOC131043096 n=1 Tax=Cryptomeria japonica TaxID=3369 RepID=UPI0024089299|nr:uncharacterized protein LOC131043096 [Cryptomeria japonica]GLJ28235.1 hypothetical protein SUGI_0554660 [Cryptomeria japonica]